MPIICQSNDVIISGSNSVVCGYAIKISNIHSDTEGIEVTIDDVEFFDITEGYNSKIMSNNVILSHHLVSKNINNNTAVINITTSTNPCDPNPCTDQICNIIYDVQRIPTGYECVHDVDTTTHFLDLIISPYSWYTPQGAADYLVTNLVGINGAIMNWLTPLTGWTFLHTEIITDGSNVIIRVHLNDGSVALSPTIFSASDIQTLAAPVAAAEIIILAAVAGVIFIAVGVVFAVTLIKFSTGTKDVEKQFTPEDVVKLVISAPDSIVARQLVNCDTNFAGNAVGLKGCYDSVIAGAQDGLSDKLNLPPPQVESPVETQKCVDQYAIDSNWENYQTCLRKVKDKAGEELRNEVTCLSGQHFDISQGKCVQTADDCWIPSLTPGSCILTASTGKMVAIVIIGGYLIFRLIKK